MVDVDISSKLATTLLNWVGLGEGARLGWFDYLELFFCFVICYTIDEICMYVFLTRAMLPKVEGQRVQLN